MQEYTFDTVIVGTGCAGYNCADWLYTLGRRDLAIVTRGRLSGASRNTGSDKQTYYKLSLASGMPDSVRKMARDLCAGGGVNAGVALAEAAGSTRSFMKLVNLGVPFPCNEYGEFVGYQTDHDHSGRATSAGPYTSKYMTEALERAVLEKGIPILEGLTAFHLFTLHGRVTGLACIDEAGESEAAGLVIFHCNQLVIATGGEAAAYWDSVYPESQTGALGMLVRAGVRLVNLNHWQYGLASTKFRWNVSGSYQQALPRYVSVGADGFEHEFLTEAFPNPAEMLGRIFLKGYQWPFDAQKAEGSSKIDLLVQQECAKGRRVFLDFRRNPSGMGSGFGLIPEEAKKYLEHSGALLLTPYQRLQKLNPAAIGLYREHGIDLSNEMLEIAVCAQHQNGGADVDVNWQTSVTGLYAVGEAAGTFGAYRPGGTALNSAQVGSLRAAEHIARTGRRHPPAPIAADELERLQHDLRGYQCAQGLSHALIRQKFQQAMSRHAANRRCLSQIRMLRREIGEVLRNIPHMLASDGTFASLIETIDILTAQEAVLFAMETAGEAMGSYGGALYLDASGNVLPENPAHSQDRLITQDHICRLQKPLPIPEADIWFETVWAQYRKEHPQSSHSELR
ncbi:MAG: FAD-binding protein [Acutalibacteraceae bacterium]|mgnify:FL=1